MKHARFTFAESGNSPRNSEVLHRHENQPGEFSASENYPSNVLRMWEYAQDADRAGDRERAAFFRRAEHESRKGATPQPPTNP